MCGLTVPDLASFGWPTASDLDAFLIDINEHEYAAHTGRGFAQVVKTLCRFGHRRGFIVDDLTLDLEMPKTPLRIIETFTDN
jgi:site-specific recombinase XerD